MRLFSGLRAPVSLVRALFLLLALAGLVAADRDVRPRRPRSTALAPPGGEAQPRLNVPVPQSPNGQAGPLDVSFGIGVVGLQLTLMVLITLGALQNPAGICFYTTAAGLLPSQDYCIFETDSMFYPIVGLGIFHGLYMLSSILIVSLLASIRDLLH